jgi:hypothetical protein
MKQEPMNDSRDPNDAPSINPPIRRWLDESVDFDLILELEVLVMQRGLLGSLVATGALARHEQSAEARQAFIEGLGQGVLPPEDRQRAWARTLDDAAHEDLIAYALVMCDWLEDELTALERDDETRVRGWMTLCVLRDDIESLRALVATRSNDNTNLLDDALSRIDARAREPSCHVDTIDPGAICTRLLRATVQYPDVWWTRWYSAKDH